MTIRTDATIRINNRRNGVALVHVYQIATLFGRVLDFPYRARKKSPNPLTPHFFLAINAAARHRCLMSIQQR